MWTPRVWPRWIQPLAFAIAAAAFGAVFFWGQFAGSAAAHAQMQVLPSTPDISITVGATTSIQVPGPGGAAAGSAPQPANWISIKNDCADAVYFDLSPPPIAAAAGDDYGIRLNSGETFTGSFAMFDVIGASPAAGNTVACTVTVVFGVL